MNYTFNRLGDHMSTIANISYLYQSDNREWCENTTLLLHSQRDVDKHSKVLDILDGLKQRDVLYIDIDGRLANFCEKLSRRDKLYVYVPKFESPDSKTDYAELVFDAIEHAVKTTAIRIFVVDSITRMAMLSFGRNASASYLMKRIVAMQVRYNISVLVIAHDYNRAVTKALVTMADSDIAIANPELGVKKSSSRKAVDAADSLASATQTAENIQSPIHGGGVTDKLRNPVKNGPYFMPKGRYVGRR